MTNSYNNVIVGYQAGYNIGDGDGNVFLGNMAGYSESGNDKLYIDNSNTSTPLIYGDFSANTLRFNGSIGIGKDAASTLDVNGDINISSGSHYRIAGTNLSATDIGAESVLTKGNLTATGPILLSQTRQVIGGDAEISISDASTTGKGAVQLSNSYDKTSEILATTEKALNDGLATKVTGTDIMMGKFYSVETGHLVSTGGFSLSWDVFAGEIYIDNANDFDGGFWYTIQEGPASSGNSGIIPKEDKIIIAGWRTDFNGLEIHFGQVDGEAGWCSVWLQYLNGKLLGHYIMNQTGYYKKPRSGGVIL